MIFVYHLLTVSFVLHITLLELCSSVVSKEQHIKGTMLLNGFKWTAYERVQYLTDYIYDLHLLDNKLKFGFYLFKFIFPCAYSFVWWNVLRLQGSPPQQLVEWRIRATRGQSIAARYSGPFSTVIILPNSGTYSSTFLKSHWHSSVSNK